ncbi:MAG: MFS transporter [Solirubrobacterales bacterium]
MTRARTALALAVGLVLADSSVVVLALPEIYRQLDVSVGEVTWVLVAFNVVLAAAALPAAVAARRLGPARVTCAGLIVFALASLACGLAGEIEQLLAARCAQAVGGAAAVCGSLELLPSVTGSERLAAIDWARAGTIGAALGPGVGGLLTELISWQSIFLVQVPAAGMLVAALVGLAMREGGPDTVEAELRAPGRPHLAANAALALVSAALAAALFLVVLLLIEGWRMSPIEAALAVSVMPLAAFASRRVASDAVDGRARAAAGVVLLAGGLGGLALLPDASVLATLAPQLLMGAGLALTLEALTEAALAGRAPQAIHGGWTIAARHLGVVAGLLVLTPLFTADLEAERADAEQAGTAALLDARLDATEKLALAERIADRLAAEGDKVPVLAPAFEPLPPDPDERSDALTLRDALQDELDRAATHAFSRSFWVAALFALAALVPIALARRRPEL